MRSISSLLDTYKKILDKTYNEHSLFWQKVKAEIKNFYESFLSSLIINYGEVMLNTHRVSSIKDSIREIFGTDEIKFVAIDGSSFKEEFSEFIVFYGGAYAVRGSLKLLDSPVKIEYEKWDIKYDRSLVAYIPLPFLSLNIEEDEKTSYLTDNQKIDYLSIHNLLMQLAEIYLAYTFVKNPDSDIKIILLDNSLSSLYLSSDVLHKMNFLKILSKKFLNTQISKAHIYIAYAMPISEELDVPSCKNFHGEFYVIRKLYYRDKISLVDKCNILREKHFEKLKELNIITQDSTLNNIRMNKHLGENTKEIWDFIKKFFEFSCEKLFIDKDINVLKVDINKTNEWLSSDDIRFLISVGIRMIIEEAWQKNILIVGIAKDSASRYFTHNFLGICWYLKLYDFKLPNFAASDRLILETLPFIDEKLLAPWSTIEFDSIFMSLHIEQNENKTLSIKGFRGDILVPQERLFLRSLAQFYINRSKNTPQTGNVIFIDRIAHPLYDKDKLSNFNFEIKTYRNDQINPLFYKDCNHKNVVNEALIFIIDALTRNLFPEVIGYPDPLHKADWGAKSLNKKVKELIKSSEIKFIANPLKRGLRQKREELTNR